MLIAVIIVACLTAEPMFCETIPTGLWAVDEATCAMAGEQWAAVRLREDWNLSKIRCEAGFMDENHG